MKESHCLSIMVLGTLFLFWSQGVPADGYTLKYKLDKGKVLRYSNTMTQQISQEIMGMKNEGSTTISSEVTVTGEGETADGNIAAVVTYDSITIDLTSPMGNSNLHNPPAWIGKRVRKVIDSSGDQISTQNLDTFSSPGPGQELPTAIEFFFNLPKDEVFLNQSAMVFDEDAFEISGLKVSPKSEMEYTVLGEEKLRGYDCVKIAVKGGVGLTGEGQNSGMDMKLNGDGTMEGTLYFAPKEGLLVMMESSSTVETQVNITGPQEMTIPQTQSVKSKMELIK